MSLRRASIECFPGLSWCLGHRARGEGGTLIPQTPWQRMECRTHKRSSLGWRLLRWGKGSQPAPTPNPPYSCLKDVCPAPFMSPAMLTLTWNKQTTVKDRSLDFEIRFPCREQMSWWPNSVTKLMTYFITTDLIKKKIQLNFKMPRKFGTKEEEEEEARLPGSHWVKV